MFNHTRMIAGVLLAAAVSGPVMLLAYRVMAALGGDLGGPPLAYGLAMLAPALGLGLAFGLVPAGVGAFAMGALGVHHHRTRHPLAWIVVGALLAPASFAPIFGSSDEIALLAFAITGGVAAATCRAFAEWR